MNSSNQTVPFVGLATQGERVRDRVEQALRRVLDHGRYINGPEIEELEARLASFVGAETCVGCSSGTDALVLVMLEREIGRGDVVFVPAFTFTATAEVPLLLGATVCFVDVEARTMNVDPADFERQVLRVREAGLKPRALLAVDLFGLPADYPALYEICQHYDLDLIGDAAQSMGGALHGQKVGSLAEVTATSFFPAKPLGGYGDGGAVFVRDDDDVSGVGARLRSIREHGYGEERYDVVRLGINGRLDSFQAAVLLVKMEHFEEEVAARERLARAYEAGLEPVGAVTLPPRPQGVQCAWAQYTVQLDPEIDRDAVRTSLAERGVPTAIYYPRPLHLQPAYARDDQPAGSLPVSEGLCHRVLSLPMNPYQLEGDTERVVAALQETLG